MSFEDCDVCPNPHECNKQKFCGYDMARLLRKWKRIFKCQAGRMYRSGNVTVFVGGHDHE